MKNEYSGVAFRNLEWTCEMNFRKYSQYWHLYTDGRNADMVFRDQEDMKVGMNLMAIVSLKFPDIVVFTFELMNNHLHIILAGSRERCEDMFAELKSRLRMYFIRNGKTVNLSEFNSNLVGITSLRSLRNEMVYVNRNGYVARQDCTPFSYPWGAGPCFFNPFLKELDSLPYSKLTVREKRQICRSNDIDLPADVRVYKGVILPSSYCCIAEAESFFRSAHQYFQSLTRKFEAYSEIASRLHETVFISDEEMYAAVCSICVKLFGVKSPSMLPAKDKVEMAKRMRQDYNATSRQIKTILKLDKATVEELFPDS